MRHKILIFVGVLIFIVLIVSLYFWLHKKNTKKVNLKKDVVVAKEFNLPDATGNIVSLSEVDAKIKIINFWASWSPYSKDELLVFSRIKKEHNGDVEVLALNRDTNSADGKNFLKKLDLPEGIIFVYDKNDKYYKKMDGYAMPETIIVNDKDEVLFHKHGPMTYNDINNEIDSILK